MIQRSPTNTTKGKHMKGKLEFDLEDVFDAETFEFMLHSKDFYLAIRKFDEWLQEQIKYHDKPYDELRQRLHELLESYDVDLEMLS
jgi:hypothetical protein